MALKSVNQIRETRYGPPKLHGYISKSIIFVLLGLAFSPAGVTQNSTHLTPLVNNNYTIFQAPIKQSIILEDLRSKQISSPDDSIFGVFSPPARYNFSAALANPYSDGTNIPTSIFDEKKREDAFEKRPANESPYAVLLLMYWEKGDVPTASCSGSLLTPNWVLTASHCLVAPGKKSVNKVAVYAGGYSYDEVVRKKMADGAQLRDSKSFFVHPKYKKEGGDYDIGLVKLDKSFEMSDTVKTVNISSRPWHHRGYRKCQLTGFGIVQIGDKRADDKVRKTHTLDVKKPCLCSFRLQFMYGRSRAARYACARPLEDYGVCQGDSGGGLVCDGEVCAVAMQLVALFETYTCEIGMFTHNLKCGAANALTIFQDTCPFLRWVNSHVKLLNDSQISEECVEKDAACSLFTSGCHTILALVLVNILVNTNLFSG